VQEVTGNARTRCCRYGGRPTVGLDYVCARSGGGNVLTRTTQCVEKNTGDQGAIADGWSERGE